MHTITRGIKDAPNLILNNVAELVMFYIYFLEVICYYKY